MQRSPIENRQGVGGCEVTQEEKTAQILKYKATVDKVTEECWQLMMKEIAEYTPAEQWNLAGRIVTMLWSFVYRPAIKTALDNTINLK